MTEDKRIVELKLNLGGIQEEGTNKQTSRQLLDQVSRENYVVSPKVLRIYPYCYLRLREHQHYIEFYPSRRHRKPSIIPVKSIYYQDSML